MTTGRGSDLGYGVRVLPESGGELVVHSAELDLGWRTRAADRPGSAVTWQGRGFEVVGREAWRHGHRWLLVPWQRDEVMRVVQPLDDASVASAAGAADRDRRSTRLRPAMWALLPLLGLAPRHWQQRWRDDWGYPATLATWVSALLEAVLGAACLFQLVALVGSGTPIFGWLPLPLAAVGAVCFPEGLLRIVQVNADSEPVGSLVGLAAAVLERSPEPPPMPVAAPEVTELEVDGGLELLSPIQRRDWESPGVLRYRDRAFSLESTARLGDGWVYLFAPAVDPDPGAPQLRLLPPRPPARAPAHPAPPSVARTALVTAAVSLAPSRFQQRWAAATGARAGWFTVLGAGAELAGGIANLSGHGESGPTGVALAVFFVVEGALRLTALAVAGRPVGSVLGVPLIPLLERILPEGRGPGTPLGRR